MLSNNYVLINSANTSFLYLNKQTCFEIIIKVTTESSYLNIYFNMIHSSQISYLSLWTNIFQVKLLSTSSAVYSSNISDECIASREHTCSWRHQYQVIYRVVVKQLQPLPFPLPLNNPPPPWTTTTTAVSSNNTFHNNHGLHLSDIFVKLRTL